MIPVAQIKKELQYSTDLTDVIEVLKMIASSEFSSLSSKREKTDVIREEVVSCFRLLRSISDKNPFLYENKALPKAYLMVCSDEGFLGEVNNAIIDVALRPGQKEDIRYIVLGERGKAMLKESGVKFASFPSIENDIPYHNIMDISKYIMDLYRKREIGSLYAIYMKFQSFTNHRTDVIKLLPCDELINYIPVEKIKYTDESSKIKEPEALIEPDEYFVLEYLIKLWLESNMHNIFWSSKLSEWSIRVMHLERGADNLKEINKELKHKYFKSLHELNDKIIREICAARMV